MNLSLGQQFEMERIRRVIDAETDPLVLRGLAKQLLNAWQTQKAATSWVIKQQTPSGY
jgi:3-methyladenine DNA glycosylase AlkC